jgi:hypothetical protein
MHRSDGRLQGIWQESLIWPCSSGARTASAPSRAARSAAMLIRLARSAPLKPGVPRAITCAHARETQVKH